MKFLKHYCFSFVNIITLTVLLNADELPEITLQRNDITPQYVVVAPRTVMPGTLYGVAVTLLSDKSSSMRVSAEISREGTHVAKGRKNIDPFFTETIFLQVPQSSVSGRYRLRVQGNFEGSTGRAVFINDTELVFSPRFLSIVVQTSKPIYNSGQPVYFRVILLTTELTPFEDAVDVFVIDPDGYVMRRWVSMQLNSGVVSHKFVLPQLAKAGFWMIRVRAGEQIEEQLIKVEAYFTPQFEVHVVLPPYVLDTDEDVTATVVCQSELQRIVRGNATITVHGRHLPETDNMTMIYKQHVSMRNGSHELVLPMDTIKAAMVRLNGVELRLEASVTDYHYGDTSTGFSHTRIITSTFKVQFLGPGPQVLKPGMPLEGHVYVSYNDGEPLSEEKLTGSNLTVRATVSLEGGRTEELSAAHAADNLLELKMVDNPTLQRYHQEGLLYYRIDVPAGSSKLLLIARYEDAEGGSSEARLAVVEQFSPRKKYLSVRTSTPHPHPQEFAVFHVKANFHLTEFHYLVMSKGLLLYSGQQSAHDTLGSITTFVVSVAMRMAPGFTLLVYHVDAEGELLADKLFLPVDGFRGYECYIEVNQGKDRTMKTAQAIMPADAGSFMGINSQREPVYFMQAGNDISKSRIVDSFFKFENFSRPVAKVRRKSRQGLMPDESIYMVTMNDALDAQQVFTLANAVIFTDAHIPMSAFDEKCDQTEGYVKCLSGGCFLADKKCDGHIDCSDLSDETECEEIDDHYHYKVTRRSISSELYDAVSNNWGWQEMNGEYGGEEFLTMNIPPIGDNYYFTGFSVSKTLGFTTIEEPVQFSTTRPFMMHLEGPSSCHRGEQVGVRVLLFNNEPSEAFVFLRLHASPDYKFVHVERDSIVTSYGARLESGEHQHIVYLPAGKQQQVDIPVAPTVEQGELEVIVSAATQSGHWEESHKITVLPEGGHVNKHTSVFLDLKNRALVLRYLDIFVEESPIVPYQDWRRYIYGSPKGTITLSGDVIGPIFPSIPLTTATVLRREMKGTAGHVVELAANIWTLHYLRLTNRLQRAHIKLVLAECATMFSQVMRLYHTAGHFSNWELSQPSVWLTSWAIRIFKHASFQDWENYLYIEPRIFTQSIGWILRYQMEDGSFVETAAYKYPLDFKMYAKEREMANGTVKNANVALTAHVLITLHEVLHTVQGSLRTTAATAALKATRFLEHCFTSLTDPYEIAISAYALTMTESSEKEFAFWQLHKNSREGVDGQLYWSRYPILGNKVKKENQRPFLQPREYQEGDSQAVEATAYALLVYLIRDGVTITTEKIVDWLTSVRMTNNGFISTVDTVVALQALTEYGFRSRIMDITNMDVSIELPSSGSTQTVHIGNESVLQLHSIQIPKVWSHVNIVARGRGQAMIQMDVSYGVDHERLVERPMKDSFKLTITEFYTAFRNKSSITLQSCFRWVRSHPPVSAATILEVQLPTGYGLLESEAMSIVKSKVHPTLQDARSIPGKTIWFFDHVLPDWTCFNHTVRRWFPVANMTLHRQAFLYEANAREHFEQVLVNSTPLYILSICEVCGSYQCAYCPHYSAASRLVPAFQPVVLSLVVKCILAYFI